MRGLWSPSGAGGRGWSRGDRHGHPWTLPGRSPSAAPPALVPGLPGLRARHCPLPRPQAPNKALASILGKSNLRFAGMSIAVSISTDGLNLSVPATRQVSVTTASPAPRRAGLCVGVLTWSCATPHPSQEPSCPRGSHSPREGLGRRCCWTPGRPAETDPDPVSAVPGGRALAWNLLVETNQQNKRIITNSKKDVAPGKGCCRCAADTVT